MDDKTRLLLYFAAPYAVGETVYYKPLNLYTKVIAVRIYDDRRVIYYLEYGQRSANASELSSMIQN